MSTNKEQETTPSLSLEMIEYVNRSKRRWGCCIPEYMTVLEYYGHGYYADDLPLGKCGNIVQDYSPNRDKTAVFKTIEEAHEAAKLVKNRRPGSILGVLPTWKYD